MFDADTYGPAHAGPPSIGVNSPMIQTPTVLILGAGSSAHLNYPLGRELINRIAALGQEHLAFPMAQGWEPKQFIEELSYSDPNAIDAFLTRHPEWSELGRYLITVVLKGHERLPAMFPP